MFDKASSQRQTITTGVPQGSMLGPLLFLMFINDLHYVSDQLTLIIFADDTNIFISGKSVHQLYFVLNQELAKVGDWFSDCLISTQSWQRWNIMSCMSWLTIARQGRRNVISIGGGGLKNKNGTNGSYMWIIITNALMKHHLKHKISFYILSVFYFISFIFFCWRGGGGELNKIYLIYLFKKSLYKKYMVGTTKVV